VQTSLSQIFVGVLLALYIFFFDTNFIQSSFDAKPNLQCHRSAKENGPKKNGANTGMRLKSKPIAVYYSAFNAKSARQTMVTTVE
jgi:hypothetical protein